MMTSVDSIINDSAEYLIVPDIFCQVRNCGRQNFRITLTFALSAVYSSNCLLYTPGYFRISIQAWTSCNLFDSVYYSENGSIWAFLQFFKD
jgi:hypothetical protein